MQTLTTIQDLLVSKKEQFLKGTVRELALFQIPNTHEEYVCAQFMMCLTEQDTMQFALATAQQYQCMGVASTPELRSVYHALEWFFDASNMHELSFVHRSISVGDLVIVDNVVYVCCPMGWKQLV